MTILTKEEPIKQKALFEEGALTPEDKADIIILIKEAVKTPGSARALANKCGVSDATINLIAQDKYVTQNEDMWRKIATVVGWNKNGWSIVDTTNTKIATGVLRDAHRESLFIGVAEKAGSGKTTSINAYLANDRSRNSFKLVCRDWSRREFLIRLRIAFGVPLINGAHTLDDMLEQIIYFLICRKNKPLLILDQANSLKPSVYSYLIHIYNVMEDKMGCVMFGTENLLKDLKNGVKHERRGFDELDSRFGRNFVHLVGNTYKDVQNICSANGIADEAMHKTIWSECEPYPKTIQAHDGARQLNVIEDGRRIKRAIQKHLLLNRLAS